MIVFYIEENMQTKIYVLNVGMTGTINQIKMVNSMVLIIRYLEHVYNPKDSKALSLQIISYVPGMACLAQK
jgi:hypothetical protein